MQMMLAAWPYGELDERCTPCDHPTRDDCEPMIFLLKYLSVFYQAKSLPASFATVVAVHI
jgi:hypothetical protein